MARNFKSAALELVRNNGADLGLRNQLALYFGLSSEPPHQLAPVDLGHVILDPITRHHRLEKPRLVDRQEIDERFLNGAQRFEAEHTGGLGHALDEKNAGKHRVAGKVAEKVRLVDGDVLNTDHRLVATQLDDAVHHQERVAVRQRLEDFGDIKRLDG